MIQSECLPDSYLPCKNNPARACRKFHYVYACAIRVTTEIKELPRQVRWLAIAVLCRAFICGLAIQVLTLFGFQNLMRSSCIIPFHIPKVSVV